MIRHMGASVGDELEVNGLKTAAAWIGLKLEAQLRSLGELGNARLLNRRYVNEDILAAIVRRDEAIALGGVKEFDRAVLAHPVLLSSGTVAES